MKSKAARARLDILLAERGLAESQRKAQAMILAGEVQIDGLRAGKAGMQVERDAHIEVASRRLKYASRGGFKLEGALQDFSIDPAGLTCLDVGASTGGFTDCLLQWGARKVYAVDVNTAQLAWKLQRDARVARIERNARELNRADLPEQVDLVVVDVSFISIRKILGPVCACAKPSAEVLLLIKPQFELSRADVGRGGIVKDPRLHEKAVASVRKAARAADLLSIEARPSRLLGAEGNQEFFLRARKVVLK